MATIRWFGGAAEAAGCESQSVAGQQTLGAVLDQAVAEHPALERTLPVCSLLLDGVRTTDRSAVLSDDSLLDVLPPFAGG